MIELTTSTVYGLVDPRTAELRYVGVTAQSLGKRLRKHLAMARNGDHSYRSRWLRELFAVNVTAEMIVIEETADRSREVYWIAHYRALGARLTNLTDGGEGTHGYHFTDEQRRHLSLGQSKYQHKPHSATRRQHISDALRGRMLPETHRANIAAALTGLHPSDKTRAKLRAENARRNADPAYHKRLAEAHRGKPLSPEQRERVRQGALAYHAHRRESSTLASLGARGVLDATEPEGEG